MKTFAILSIVSAILGLSAVSVLILRSSAATPSPTALADEDVVIPSNAGTGAGAIAARGFGGNALLAPAPAQAAGSRCPEPASAYLLPGIEIAGDLDLCSWWAPSVFGDYAAVEPTTSIAYSSCEAWKDDTGASLASGTAPNSASGLAVRTNTQFVAVISMLGKDPETIGNFRARITFEPATGTSNRSRIFLTRPEWPGMTASQRQRIDQILAQLLAHEKGAQNLVGRVVSSYQEVVSVPAENEGAAAKAVADDLAPLQLERARASAQTVHALYNALTDHGSLQSALDGGDLLPFSCGPTSPGPLVKCGCESSPCRGGRLTRSKG